ncbi:MAG: tail protein X [Armatimonadota bacterium]|nr:tail protein X [bacterium]
MSSIYTTRAGDTWDIIAFNLWGNEFKMTELQQANPDYLGILVFDAGVQLVVPVVETAVSSLPPWKQ